ncbi:hypothetical protein [uncultured Anaerococcus sp.]|uniref:hypothetical protein n=1 Tax=uncultured Anaerococcus sp. TaxID=293428 RepID=UPI0026228BDD|nr:hypothetical protein [uncultured Anaerococcus sp.]
MPEVNLEKTDSQCLDGQKMKQGVVFERKLSYPLQRPFFPPSKSKKVHLGKT